MADDPDVTILFPVGSAAAPGGLPGLRRSLDSIGDDPQAQIVAVLHDGAPADAAAWLTARAAGDQRLLVLGEAGDASDTCNGEARARARKGAVWARNVGIAAAAAPLVAFLDPGDVWLPGKLGAQRALHAGHPALGFSFTDCCRTGNPGSSALGGWLHAMARHDDCTSAFLLRADAWPQLFAEDLVVASTVVARTDLLRDLCGFALDCTAPEQDLWRRLAAQAPVACRPVTTVEVMRLGTLEAARARPSIPARHHKLRPAAGARCHGMVNPPHPA